MSKGRSLGLKGWGGCLTSHSRPGRAYRVLSRAFQQAGSTGPGRYRGMGKQLRVRSLQPPRSAPRACQFRHTSYCPYCPHMETSACVGGYGVHGLPGNLQARGQISAPPLVAVCLQPALVCPLCPKTRFFMRWRGVATANKKLHQSPLPGCPLLGLLSTQQLYVLRQPKLDKLESVC